MENNDITKKGTASSRFAIFNTEIAEIRETLFINLRGAGLTPGDFERIKVPAGGATAWTVQGLNGEEIVKEISGIIIAWHDTRAFWSVPKGESEGRNMPPDCFSLDACTGTGTPGGDCRTCEKAKFGSAPKGDGQACKLVRQMFLLREEGLLPEIVNLPRTSVRAARRYFLRLASRVVPCNSLITNFGLEKAMNSQGTFSRAVLTAGDRLTREQLQRVKEYTAIIEPFLKAVPAIPVARELDETTEGEVV
jgi:hypothetical protein